MKHPKRFLALLLTLTLCLSCLAGTVGAENGPPAAASAPVPEAEQRPRSAVRLPAWDLSAEESVRVIVLLEGEPAAKATTLTRSPQRLRLAAQRAALLRGLDQAGAAYRVNGEFDTLLNAVALTLSGSDLEKLAAQPGLRALCLDNRYDPPAPVQTASVNEMTGGDWMHASGWKGSGRVIAILDTGLNLTHEAFGLWNGMLTEARLSRQTVENSIAELERGVWLSDKLPFAYDYADEDDDASDDASGHGTSAAAVAAGYALEADGAVKFSGAAPDAQLLAMKIYPSGTENPATCASVFLRAMEDAYLLGADVIDLSLGSPSGFHEDPALQSLILEGVFQTLREQGVIVVCGAGDDGSMAAESSSRAGSGFVTADYADYGVLSSPASLDGTVAVAAAANRYRYVQSIRVGERLVPISDADGRFLSTLAEQSQGSLEYVVVPNYGEAEDYAGLMIPGRVALVARGGISLQEKLDAAAEAGAVGILIWNDVPGTLTLSLTDCRIPAAAISQEDGAWMISQAVTRDPAQELARSDSEEDLTGVYTRISGGSELTPDSDLLVVSETAALAFNAGLGNDSINNPGNSLALRIRGRMISGIAELLGAELNYNAGLLSNNNRYLASAAADGSVTMVDSPEDLHVSVGEDGSAEIVSRQAALRYNQSVNAFRFCLPSDALYSDPAARVYFYKWGPAPEWLPTDIGSLTLEGELAQVPAEDGGGPAAYSSLGVTPDLQLKPSLTGVGSYVWSAGAAGNDVYESLSGTSMASANAAGAFACLLQALAQQRPELSAAARVTLAEALLESSAALLTDENGQLCSPRKQGAGLIDLKAAAEARVAITNPILSLGDSAEGVFTLCFTLQSLSDQPLSYTLRVTALRDECLALDLDGDGQPEGSYNSLRSLDISDDVEISGDTTLTLPAGGSVEAALTLRVGEEQLASILADFPNGGYLDGVIALYPAEPACAGGASCPGGHFVDMPSRKNWAHEGIDFVVRRGLFSGTSDTTFSPNDSMTRSMMVTVLYALAGKPEPQGSNPFRDVRKKDWFYKAVLWAAENGIVAGVGEGKFNPNGKITREQMAAILFKYAQFAHINTDVRADLSGYPDAKKVSSYARTAMRWAVGAGVLAGVADNGKVYLRPAADATRAQVATIFKSFVRNCVETSPLYAETHAVFTGFLGDWAQAPILEPWDWRDLAEGETGSSGETPEVNTACSVALVTDRDSVLDEDAQGHWLGDNPYGPTAYRDSRAALSLRGAQNAVAIRPMLLRNARRLIMTVTDLDTGALYRAEELEYVRKSAWDSARSRWLPAAYLCCDGTDAQGNPLPDGTQVEIRLYASLDWGEDLLGQIPLEELAARGEDFLVWHFGLTVDNTAPTLENLRYDPTAKTLTFTLRDDSFAAWGQLLPTRFLPDGDDEIPIQGPIWTELWAGEAPGEGSTVTVRNVLPGEYLLRGADYAANETTVALSVGSTSALYQVRFICPAGCDTDLADAYYATEGAALTMPFLTGEAAEGDFIGWLPEPLTGVWSWEELVSVALDEEVVLAGRTAEIYGDNVYYALFTVPLELEAEPETLLEFQQSLPTYDGTWAFAGADDADGTPFLSGDGTTQYAETGVEPDTDDAVLLDSSENLQFSVTSAEGDGNYILEQGGRCLALAGTDLTFVEEPDETALWQIRFDPEAAAFEVKNANGLLLVFDAAAGSFHGAQPDSQNPAAQRLRLFGGQVIRVGYITVQEE